MNTKLTSPDADAHNRTFLKQKRTYRGCEGPDGETEVTVELTPPGGQQPLHHVVLHSPTGFAWGYHGSGPSDLALSILADILGERPTKKELYNGEPRCWQFHQAFKRDVIAKLAEWPEPWTLSGEVVRDWLEDKGVSV